MIPGTDRIRAVDRPTADVRSESSRCQGSRRPLFAPCLLVGGLFVLFGLACGEPGITGSGPIVAITLTPPSVVMSIDDRIELTAVATNARGETVPTSFSWTSSNTDVAAVNEAGSVTALDSGDATITASADGVSADAAVEVEPGLSGFMKDYIEALFLGSGRFIPQDGFTACVRAPGRWAAFPRGTIVNVVASNSLDVGSDNVNTQALLQAALATVEEATLGEITTTFTTTDDGDPLPGVDEATATDHPDPVSTGCAFDRGCVHLTFRDPEFTILQSSRSVLRESIQPADAYVHDVIGHGIMGMCHIDQELIGGNDQSLMAGGPGAFTGFLPDQLSELDIMAAKAVYGSDLQPGATRGAFATRLLVRRSSAFAFGSSVSTNSKPAGAVPR